MLPLLVSSSKRLKNDDFASVVDGGAIDALAVVVLAKPGVTAAVIRSFVLAARSNVLYKANTSFCIPDFATMIVDRSNQDYYCESAINLLSTLFPDVEPDQL